LSLPEILQFNF